MIDGVSKCVKMNNESEVKQMKLKDAVLTYRARNNMTQNDFAQKVGLSRSTIARFESGKYNPTPLTEAKIKIIIEGENV